METHVTSCIAFLALLVSSELVNSSFVESSSTSNHGKVSKKSPRSISWDRRPKDDTELSQAFIDAEKRARETNPNKNEPECSPKCVNGECARLNTCDCEFGWMGESCSESLFCVVILPSNVSRLGPSHQQNVHYERDNYSTITFTSSKIEFSNEDNFMVWKRPKCTAECNQSTSIAVDVLHRADMAYYLLPINASCDASKTYAHTLEQYKYPIAGGAAILLLAIVICTVCVVRRKREPGVILDEDSGNNYEYIDVTKSGQNIVHHMHYAMK